MTAKKLFTVFAALLLAVMAVPFANAESGAFRIDDVDFDDPVIPGESVAIVVTLANDDLKLDVEQIEVKAWAVDQFGERITDKAVISGFQVQQNDDTEKTVNLRFPAETEEGEYTLVLTADGRWENTGEFVSLRFEDTIEVEQADDSLLTSEIRLTKETYKSGDTVDVAVTVMNNGVEDQSSVTVAVAVPELDILKSITLFGTLFAGSEQTVYFTFQLPDDANGIYNLKATASNAAAKSTASVNLVVESAAKASSSNTAVTEMSREMTVGKSEDFQIKVANKGSEVKSYLVTVSGDLEGSASPASFRLNPGETKTVDVELTAKSAGEQSAVVQVQQGSSVVSEVRVSANVAQGLTQSAGAFIVLVLLIAGVVLYMQHKNPNANASGDKKKTLYY